MVSRAQPILGTFVEVTVPKAFSKAIDLAFAAIKEVHRLMSFHEGGSDVSRINRAAIGETIECDPQTVEVVATACQLFEQSRGLFDITVAPKLVRTGYLPSNPTLPLRLYGGRCSDIDVTGARTIRLTRRVMIDLGGIAKGYAVDRAIEILGEAGVPSAMVNAGGDLRCFGPQPWPVHLRNANGTVGREIHIRNQALASSANVLSRKRRLSGTVSPHIGPNRKPITINTTISIVADRCMLADAMTKVAMSDHNLANQMLETAGGYVLEDIPALIKAGS